MGSRRKVAARDFHQGGKDRHDGNGRAEGIRRRRDEQRHGCACDQGIGQGLRRALDGYRGPQRARRRPDQSLRHGGTKKEISPAPNERRMDRRLGPDRTKRGQRYGRNRNESEPGGRTMADQRDEEIHHQRTHGRSRRGHGHDRPDRQGQKRDQRFHFDERSGHAGAKDSHLRNAGERHRRAAFRKLKGENCSANAGAAANRR